jgi:hypothetical protein
MKARNFLLVTVALGSFVFAGATPFAEAGSSIDYQPHSIFASGIGDGAYLEFRRLPSLGHNIYANLRIDGVPAAGIGYGHTYRTYLSPGRHVLTVVGTPRNIRFAPWSREISVRAGEAYYLTATSRAHRLVLVKPRPFYALGY